MPETAWPSTSRRPASALPVGLVVDPEDPRLAGARWMLLWAKDPLGECCCPRGTVRNSEDGTAHVGACTAPGKHPWIVRSQGELTGFVHGASDALEYAELVDQHGTPGGARQLGVTLRDLIVVDLDNPRALRDFARCWFTVPRETIMGVSTSPRGHHVWLACPGWDQRPLNLWMAQWLGRWDPTNAAAVGRRGFAFDVRTGDNRYVVWPGQHPDRQWMAPSSFAALMREQLIGMPADRMAPSDTKGPWAVDTSEGTTVAQFISDNTVGGEIEVENLIFDGSASELEQTWSELERRAARLLAMPPGSGRNSALNVLAYYCGSTAVAAGHPYPQVHGYLMALGEQAGTHGVRDTVASGLRSGLSALKKQLPELAKA